MSKVKVFLCGVLMGIADVIPGISGGTIAFITGIYTELVASLNFWHVPFRQALCKLDFGTMLRLINWKFLLPLFTGICLSVFSFAGVITFLLQNYPLFVRGFFAGLILSSMLLIFFSIKKIKVVNIGIFVLFAGLAYCILTLSQLSLGFSYWNLFWAASFAICAMLLPGISGAYVLLILGQYDIVLQAVNDLNFSVLAVASCGAVCGLVCFAKLLHYLLREHYESTLYSLLGMMCGFLPAIWPWIENGQRYWPTTFDADLSLTLLLMFLGLAIPYFLKRLLTAKKFKVVCA